MSASDGPETPPADQRPGDDWSTLLLAIARGRDRRAFEQLFLHFAPRVKSYMLRGGMPPGAAEDTLERKKGARLGGGPSSPP